MRSASLLSQQAAPRPPSVMCVSTRMRPAGVPWVKIPQIKKYNGWESSVFSRFVEHKQRHERRSLFLVRNHIQPVPVFAMLSQMENKGGHDNL